MSCCSDLFQKAEEKKKKKKKENPQLSKGQQKQEALLEQSCHPLLEAAAQ